MEIRRSDLEEAYNIIKNWVHQTPLEYSRSLSTRVQAEVWVKLENLQKTGSFKIRGATYKLYKLKKKDPNLTQVWAASAGNHAQGVAQAALWMGVTSCIVMPTTASRVKVQATQSYQAQVILQGENVDQAIAFAAAESQKRGDPLIHPFDDDDIILGQSTLGSELIQQLPSGLDWILVPVGGGGLISGVGLVIKSFWPSCQVIGVVSDKATGYWEWYHGQPFGKAQAPFSFTIADGIAIKKPSLRLWNEYLKNQVDDWVAVSDTEAAIALVWALERLKVVLEPSAAVGLAALLSEKFIPKKGSRGGIILSGGNVDLTVLARLIPHALIRDGQICQLVVFIEDRPGALEKIAGVLARFQANILDVRHERMLPDMEVGCAQLWILVELRQNDYRSLIIQDLKNLGFTAWWADEKGGSNG